MSFARLARLSGIRAGFTLSRVMEIRGPFQQVQGRICSPWLQRAGSVSKVKMFVSKGQRFMSKRATPEITHECEKMMRELTSRGQHLKQKMRFLDNMNIMMIGLTGGALVAVTGQHYSNVKESEKRAEELSRAQEDLKTGQDSLAKMVATIAELKELYGQREGPATARPASRSSH